ncbi:hypothetical protein BGY98DRAFT_1101193 [Russula aff. rugulosa BPL654]|nr:hypothetical protein BGY98DRAFT_1101193 [Russula aff. rugulosa BPL654]
MPSNSYLSLLVLALAASTVSPVRCAETQQIEDRGDTASAPASASRHHTRSNAKTGVFLGLGLTGFLLTVALVNTFYTGDNSKKPNQATRPPPNSTTQPTSSPNNPPRAFVGREERDLDPGFVVDAISEPYPNLHLHDISDGVFNIAGSSEARSISSQDGPGHTSSSLDSLSRANLAKELILFSRMLDKLD